MDPPEVDEFFVRSNDDKKRHAQETAIGQESTIDHDGSEDRPLLGLGKNDDPQSIDVDGDDNEKNVEFAHLPWHKRPSIYWIIPPFFILALSFGGIIAPRITIVLNIICRDYLQHSQPFTPHTSLLQTYGSNPECRIVPVQERAAKFNLYCNLFGGVIAAITSPKIGALSDRYGRTTLIALTSIGLLFELIFTILAARLPDKFSINWIFAGYIIDGFCGSFTSTCAITNAYATDCTPKSTRNVAFAYFHACLYLGIALGPFAAAFVTKLTGTPMTSFYIMVGVLVGFILFMKFVVPESLSEKRKAIAREKRLEMKSVKKDRSWSQRINILDPLRVLWPRDEPFRKKTLLRRNLVLLAAIDTMQYGVTMSIFGLIIMYTNFRFGWATYESGLFMGITNLSRVVCLLLVLPFAARLYRNHQAKKNIRMSQGADVFDLTVMRIAVFFDIVGYLGYTLATSGTMVTVAGVIASFGAVGSPTLQSALTKHVSADKTGEVLGAMSLLHVLARTVAPTICNAIYATTLSTSPAAVFVALTATFALAFVFTFFVKSGVSYEDNHASNDVMDERTALLNDTNQG